MERVASGYRRVDEGVVDEQFQQMFIAESKQKIRAAAKAAFVEGYKICLCFALRYLRVETSQVN